MFKILDEVCEPKRGTKYSAYVDLFSREDVVIGAGETKVIKLGIEIDFDKLKANVISLVGAAIHIDDEDSIFNKFRESHYLEVALRSSLAVKGLTIANGIGIIDLDFENEIGLIVHNPIKMSNNQGIPDQYLLHPFYINKGDKVAQCTIKEHQSYLMGYKSDAVRVGGYGRQENEIYSSRINRRQGCQNKTRKRKSTKAIQKNTCSRWCCKYVFR